MKKWIAGAIAVYAAAWAGQAIAQEKLTVWWVKGFYKAEDDALFAAIKKFEAKTGVKVDLSQYADPGHDPEDGRRARLRHRAGRRLCRHLSTSRSPASGPSRASSRTSPTSSSR